MPVMITHDTSVDYDVHGDGPALILIGGLGFGRWGWFKQIPALSRHFRTITFDASRDAENIVAPTLVIHGADDQYVPLANAAALAEAIPDAGLRDWLSR